MLTGRMVGMAIGLAAGLGMLIYAIATDRMVRDGIRALWKGGR